MPKASERAIKLAKEVLAKCMAYDPHFPRPSEATTRAWAEHISLKNPSREDMLDAVAKFYETNADVKPLPASITNIARTIRQESLLKDDYRPPPDKSDDPEPVCFQDEFNSKKISMAEWEQLHGQKFPKLVLGHVDDPDVQLDGPNPLRVHCPYCKSGPGSPCTIPGSMHLLTKTRAHESRCAIVEKRCGGMHHEEPHTEGCGLA